MSPETPQRCPECDGQGWYEVTGSAHDPNCNGSCVNCPIPVPMQEQCEECGGTGDAAPVPAPKRPSGNNLAIGRESEANITERELAPANPLAVICPGCNKPILVNQARTIDEIARKVWHPKCWLSRDLGAASPEPPRCDHAAVLKTSGWCDCGTLVKQAYSPKPAAAPTGTGEESLPCNTILGYDGRTHELHTSSGDVKKQDYEHCPDCNEYNDIFSGPRHKPFCPRVDKLSALRSQLEGALDRGNGYLAEMTQWRGKYETAERDLATAQRENVKLQHELADDEIELRGARNLEKTYISVKNDLATAQVRIVRLEEALQKMPRQYVNEVENAAPVKEAYEWIKEKCSRALAEPQSGEKGKV